MTKAALRRATAGRAPVRSQAAAPTAGAIALLRGEAD